MRALAFVYDACLPFVTRALRGRRLRLTLALSGILAVFSILLGFWLALGHGHLERELRVGLDLEPSTWERRSREFTLVLDEPYDPAHPTQDQWHVPSQLAAMQNDGRAVLRALVDAGVPSTDIELYPEHYASKAPPEVVPRAELEALHARAVDALARHPAPLEDPGYVAGFSWHHRRDLDAARAMLDADLQPRIEVYRSPLSVTDGVGMVGLVAGGLMLLLGFVAAPVLAGMSVAQEVHENTLQPITGTALTPRQLVLGLAAAAWAPVGIIALPQAALFLVSATAVGGLLFALGTLAVAVAVSLFAVMGAQLIALALGSKRTPGMIAVALLLLLGLACLMGAGFGVTLEEDTAGLVTVLPPMGPAYLGARAVLPAVLQGPPTPVPWELGLATLTFATMGLLLALAFERKLLGRVQPALRLFPEALVAVLLLILSALAALPPEAFRPSEAGPVYAVTFAMLMIPAQLVLMARVPTGDIPAQLRSVPLGALLVEFVGYFALHLVVATLLGCGGPWSELAESPASAVYYGWAVVIGALIAIRAVALPVRFASFLALAIASASVVAAFGMGTAIADAPRLAIVPTFELSPLLGIGQLVAMVVIPAWLLRSVRRGSASRSPGAKD